MPGLFRAPDWNCKKTNCTSVIGAQYQAFYIPTTFCNLSQIWVAGQHWQDELWSHRKRFLFPLSRVLRVLAATSTTGSDSDMVAKPCTLPPCMVATPCTSPPCSMMNYTRWMCGWNSLTIYPNIASRNIICSILNFVLQAPLVLRECWNITWALWGGWEGGI